MGFSTGSSYYPGPWTSTDELVEICELVHDLGGVYMAEPRRANLERAFGGGGVQEVLEIGRRSGVKLHFAHFRTDPRTAGKVEEQMALIDGAKAEGLDITLDIYPYASGSTIPVSFLPSWAQEGGPAGIIERLKDPGDRKRIVDYLENEYYYLRSLDEVVFSYIPGDPSLEGISLPVYADRIGKSLGEALCEILLQEDLSVRLHDAAAHELWALETGPVRTRWSSSRGTTTWSAPTSPRRGRCRTRVPTGRSRASSDGCGRAYPTVSLEGMVHRMTDRPARRFNLTDRGRLEEGYYADVTIFDAERVIDTATYDDPIQYPVGIPYVLVNGQVAVDSERCTGVIAGQAVP